MDGQKQAKKHRPNLTKAKLPPLPRLPPLPEGVTLPNRVAKEVIIRPTFRDLGSDEAVWALYHRWCLHYNMCRTSEEMGTRLDIFMKNVIHVVEMNELDPDPLCQIHLSSSCNEKDLFDWSGDEEMTLTPTERDLESDEAVLDLYYRWCLYHKILRTPEEMQQRFNNFKMSAIHAFKMNQKDPSCHFCLSFWCDKIDLHCSSGVEEMTLTPTEGDLESDEALMDLYRRWCLHHKIHRTPKEMQLGFSSFKKSATHVFEMSQVDPTVQFCLSIWCDETDHHVDEVTLIPTERDLKSGNALLGLYHRYCLAYMKPRTRTPKEMHQRFYNFKKSVNHVFEKNKTDPSWQFILSSYCDEKDLLDRAARKVSIRPKFRDLGSDEAVWALYHRWCLHYNIRRTSEEMGTRFNIFMKNAIHVFEMNELDPDPFCQFHLSSSCDEKDLFDWSGDEEMTLTPTERDLESDEAVLYLYYRWCLYHKILRTPEEMQQRFNNFKMSAIQAFKMNQKDPSCHFCLSFWCDKIDLRCSSGVEEMTLTPTKGDLESDEALMDLYHRWCLHHKIRRTPEEMQLAFSSFKKSATHVFEMSQKDPTVQFCLSIWCDETDHCHRQVTLIPTERDLKSGNALLGLYHRYCLNYGKYMIWTPEEMHQSFYNFKKSVNHVFEKNKMDPSWQFFLSSCCDEKDMLDRAAVNVSIIPTFRDLGSDEAVWALYRKWCLHYHICRTSEEMQQRFNIFKKTAHEVFEGNIERPGSRTMFMGCDGESFFWGGVTFSSDEEGSSSDS